MPDVLCKSEWGVLERQAKGGRGAGNGDGESSRALTLFAYGLSKILQV